jgi:hypothetical protein
MHSHVLGFTGRYPESLAEAERDPLIFWGRDIPIWDGIRAHPRIGGVMRNIWG